MKAIALEKAAKDPTEGSFGLHRPHDRYSNLDEVELAEAELRQQQHWDEFYKCNKDKFFKDRQCAPSPARRRC